MKKLQVIVGSTRPTRAAGDLVPWVVDRAEQGDGFEGGVPATRLSQHPTRSIVLLAPGAACGVDGHEDDRRDPAHSPASPSTTR
jgi:hypothetical protein